jgi:ubiquitin-like 1-activating enzyme E1 B
VFDEGDEDAKVDVIFSVIEQEAEEGAPPISLPDEIVIAKKPKKAAPETNGDATNNGKIDATMHSTTNGVTNGATKRKADEAELEGAIVRKKGKVMGEPSTNGSKENDIVVIEDDGAIVLD